MLYDINAATMLLGCFCYRPHLVFSEKYRIEKNDFRCAEVEESHFYHIVYRAIYNLAREGASEIDGIILDMFLQSHPKELALCTAYKHIEFIDTIKKIADPNNIEVYYNTVRKCAMLREYKQKGFDVSPFDGNTDYSQADIANYFNSIQIEIKQKYVTSEGVEHHNAGEGLGNSIDSFKQKSALGLSFQNLYLNRVLGGINGLVLRSSDQGSGKSMLMVADTCISSCEHLYDSKQGKYVPNPAFAGNVLFINTELQFERQLQPMFAAFVSDVERYKIRWGEYDSPSEEERVRSAESILKKHTYIVDMPDFTLSKIEDTIVYYVEKYNIRMCVFDYVSFNQHLSAELAQNSKVMLREDMALLELTRRLKELSLYYDIPILSGTQTSRASREKFSVDATWLAGGLSLLHKADSVLVLTQVGKKEAGELEPLQGLIEEMGVEPTHCIHMLKGRDSRFPDLIKIYCNINLGTGRDIPMFVLNKEGDEVVKVTPLQIVRKEIEGQIQ